VRLKAAASFAEAGDIHDIVDELWKGAGTKKQALIDTVSSISLSVIRPNADRPRKLIYSLSGLTRHLWSLMTLFPTQRLLLLFRFCITVW
jgi:hypothetical protein